MPDPDPSVALRLKLPTSIRAKLDLYLFSELEGRVPKGDYREFFIERIKEFFDSRRLDLHPYGFPAGYSVFGPKEVIDALERKLKE